MKNDDDISSKSFDMEMSKIGVSPLKKRQEKVLLRSSDRNLNLAVLRETAASGLPQSNDPRHYSGIEWLGPHDVVEYKKDGIQHEVFKNLKQGRYEIGADLDLHSYRVEDAKIALFQFIQDCLDHDVRYAIIIHGKGWHGQNDKNDEVEKIKDKPQSRLKSYTVHWLKTMDAVLAFSSAQARDGGTGALYVLLKNKTRLKDI